MEVKKSHVETEFFFLINFYKKKFQSKIEKKIKQD